MTPEAMKAALLKENEGRCRPPLSESEIERIAISVGQYDPAHTPEDRLRLAGLTQLNAAASMDAVSAGIRNLVELVDGADLLDRETTGAGRNFSFCGRRAKQQKPPRSC